MALSLSFRFFASVTGLRHLDLFRSGILLSVQLTQPLFFLLRFLCQILPAFLTRIVWFHKFEFLSEQFLHSSRS
jgi:hypothetical protein